MKVILTHDVPQLGRVGETVDVRDGYARNYLFPRHLAVVATPGELEAWERRRKSIARKEGEARQEMDELCRRLEAQPFEITARVGEQDKLFGSVTESDIADVVRRIVQVEIDRRKIHLEEPIKRTGEFRVPVKLHPEVEANLLVRVIPQ